MGRGGAILAIACCSVALLAAGVALVGTPQAHAATSARPTAGPGPAAWPVPVPGWFWTWARWYLGRGEFAEGPLRDPATRPDEAPKRLPPWAWRRLAAVVGQEPPPVEEEPPPAEARVRTWPVPIPQWFWTWGRWYLGRGEFAGETLRSQATRPPRAPRLVPEWAWHRLAVVEGEDPPDLPTTPLSTGASGRAVEGLQRALNAAGYPAGSIDGRFGSKTRDAVVAWEKVHGHARDGVVSVDEYPLILRTLRPAPPLAGSDYVYVDLARQVLFEVDGGRVRNVIAVSTGGGYTYTGRDGTRRVAVTPRGSYRVQRKVPGWDDSYLGRLYYPSYYSGGYAIHGSPSVPTGPASHGCVRIPLWLSAAFYRRTSIGTQVVVR